MGDCRYTLDRAAITVLTIAAARLASIEFWENEPDLNGAATRREGGR